MTGLYRAKVISFTQFNPFIVANVNPCKEVDYKPTAKDNAFIRNTISLFSEYANSFKGNAPDFTANFENAGCGAIADFIASNSNLTFATKQEILEEIHPFKRIEMLYKFIEDELAVLKIESEIMRKAQENIDENQREYVLREQMKVIASELGEDDSPEEEADELRTSIEIRIIPEEVKVKLLKECDKLQKMPYGSHEASVIRLYIDTCLELPWDKKSVEKIRLI